MSSLSWLWTLRLVWKRSSNNSKFSDFPSNVGIVVSSDFSKLEIRKILLFTFAEMVLFANCWTANKTWSASIVGVVFSLRNCGWLAEWVFFCLPEDVPGEQQVISSGTPVTMSWPSLGPEFRVVCLCEMFASGWRWLWESSPFVRWFVPGEFRNVSGADPGWPRISGFRKNSSCWEREHVKSGSRFHWIQWTASLLLYPQFPQKLDWFKPLVIWEFSCFVPGCS